MKTYGKSKGIALPFLTTKLDGGDWSAAGPCFFTPGQTFSDTIGKEAGWSEEPVWTQWRREQSLTAGENRTPAVQPAAYINCLCNQTVEAHRTVRRRGSHIF
jgi:hypothetical protein